MSASTSGVRGCGTEMRLDALKRPHPESSTATVSTAAAATARPHLQFFSLCIGSKSRTRATASPVKINEFSQRKLTNALPACQRRAAACCLLPVQHERRFVEARADGVD